MRWGPCDQFAILLLTCGDRIGRHHGQKQDEQNEHSHVIRSDGLTSMAALVFLVG